MKKSQITLIVMLGMVLLILFFLIYLLGTTSELGPLHFDKGSIQEYVNGCLTTVAEQGLLVLGRQGGTIILDEYISTPQFGVSLYTKEGNNLMPDLDYMEDQLSFYIDNNMNSCIQDFEQLKRLGWKVEQQSIQTSTTISSDQLVIRARYPLTVSKGEESLFIDQFSTSLPSSLHHIHRLANNVVEFSLENPSQTDMTMLNTFSFNITIFPYDNSLMYFIEDGQHLIDNKPFRFFFGLQ